jgi:RNA polymerase sigma-70 factor, ECF subfamily
MSSPAPSDVTRLLEKASEGDTGAMASLFDVLYRELRRLAVSTMRAERRDHTLQPTALVHEAFMRLADERTPLAGRNHFFGVAAVAMRRILVEHARARHALKRGGHAPKISLDGIDVAMATLTEDVDLDALDRALTRLGELDPRQARIVELRYFAGLSVDETAGVVGLSTRTVKREWALSRAWLRREMARLEGGADLGGGRPEPWR